MKQWSVVNIIMIKSIECTNYRYTISVSVGALYTRVRITYAPSSNPNSVSS